jgi:hypothetical protein
LNRGTRLIAGGDGVLERLLGGDLLGGQAFLALVILLGLDQRRPGLRGLRVGACQRGLIGPRIDAEEDLADIDDSALQVLALEAGYRSPGRGSTTRKPATRPENSRGNGTSAAASATTPTWGGGGA